MKSRGSILDVSDLTVKIGNEKMLDKINFKIPKGITVAVIGPNGAGKSTLFKALLNLVPYDGKIKWNEKIRIGYVPQNFSVSGMPLSVREFLSFKNGSNAKRALDLVKLDGKKILDKRLDSLSGGELQKVLIAWAIADKPDVLLFDEPTTGVDVGSEEIIYEMLSRLEKETKITVLLITHNLHVVKYYSDYVLALNRHMIFFGKSKKITEPYLLREVYGSESLFEKHVHEE